MDKQEISVIIAKVLGETLGHLNGKPLPAEVSARHVHLSKQDVEMLFGQGHTLTPKRNLSQPGQFLSEERVDIVTTKGTFRNVAVLGPVREHTQVELSMADAKTLGVDAPIRQSGDTKGAGCVYLVTENGMVMAKDSAIVAQNHIHMTNNDARQFGVSDGELVKVQMRTARPLTFDNVVVRVSDKFALAMHIDVDEANACAFKAGDTALLLKGGSTIAEKPISVETSTAQSVPAPATATNEKKSVLITEEIAKTMLADGKKTVALCKNAILTPMARDVFFAARVEIERK